jgi:hypothetical protein
MVRGMKDSPFLMLGFVGIAVTFLLQLIIVFLLDKQFDSWWAFYSAWFLFLFIGIGKILARKNKQK